MALSPYMGLLLPDPSGTLGPLWASELNAAFEVVDAHDHTTGYGVAIPTAGINVNADFSFNGFLIQGIQSIRLDDVTTALSGPADLGCFYRAGPDVWYNDGSGNQIQLTAGGALNAASIGGIGGDYSTSTASVFYTASTKTFTFWQDTNTSALIDVGTIKLRNTSASSNAVSIKAPSSFSSYNLTLLTSLPASTKLLNVDSTGQVGAADNATLIGTLNVGGLLTASAGLTLTGTLAMTGTLAVTGAATISSTLGVTGLATFGSSTGTDTTTPQLTLNTNTGIARLRLQDTNSSTHIWDIFRDKFNSSNLAFATSSGTQAYLTTAGAFSTVGQISAGTAVFGQYFSPTQASPATPPANRLYNDVIPKAWAYVDGSATGTTTVGVNLTVGHSTDINVGEYNYTFKTAMANTNYAVVVTSHSNNGNLFHPYVISKTTGTFTVVFKNTSGTEGQQNHSVIVMGAQ